MPVKQIAVQAFLPGFMYSTKPFHTAREGEVLLLAARWSIEHDLDAGY